MKKLLLFLIAVCIITNANAQDTIFKILRVGEQTTPLKNGFAHVSLFYPVSTSGKQSVRTRYNLSLNIGYGVTGGINGIEISGLGGISQGNVTGIQIAGLASLGNNITGVQLSGLVSGGNNVSGIQFGGLAGLANDLNGLQISGLAGLTNNSKGIQINGLIGVANSFKGLQISGLTGITTSMNGVQINGLVGIANDYQGVQFNGLVGIVNNLKAIQFTGGVGIANNIKGGQINGLVGIANNVNGLQVSGLVNRANQLNGFQLGFINITDTVTGGIPMGLVSIVKNGGYSHWEIFSSDIVHAGVSFKLGIRKFYSIYSLGFNFFEDRLFSAGFGFGSNIPLCNNELYEFQPEIVNYSYLPTDFKNLRVTNATQLKIGFVRNFGKVGIFAAPSVYVAVMDKKNDVYGYNISTIGTVYDKEHSSSKISIGIGYTVGINLK